MPDTIYDESGVHMGWTAPFPASTVPTHQEERPMTADEFLADWISKHVKGGAPETDANKLAEELLFAAAQNEIDANAVEAAAGENLENYLTDSIRKADERSQREQARFEPKE